MSFWSKFFSMKEKLKRDPEKLVQSLSDPKEGQIAALILGKIGEPAVPTLLKALRNPELRNNAVEALGNIRSREAVDPLLTLLEKPEWNPALWQRIAWALGEIGDGKAASTLKRLLFYCYEQYQITGDEQVFLNVRRHVIKAFGKLHPLDDLEVIGLLIGAAFDEDEKMTQNSLRLGRKLVLLKRETEIKKWLRS